MHRRLTFVAAGAVLAAAALLPVSPAVATATPAAGVAVPLAVADSAPASFNSVLTINGKVVTEAHTSRVTPAGSGPTGQSLHCNNTYNFPDTNGNYTIQHACGGSTGPWGYKIFPSTCAKSGGVAGVVHEAGMSWARNGATQGTQAPHPEACDYQFHGNYNPDRDYDHIAYSDVFTWVTGQGGQAQLQIYGNFTTTGSPCSPTSC